MTDRRLIITIFLGSTLLAACKETDEPTDTNESSSTDAATEPTTNSTETTSGASETTTGAATELTSGDTMETSGATGETTEPGCTPEECGVEKFPPVMCNEVMCVMGQICVQPGEDCDYEKDPPEYFTPPPGCQDVPAECVAKDWDELASCLGGELCGPSIVGDPEYFAGKLDCPAVAADCF